MISKRTLGREYAFKFLYKHLINLFENEKKEIANNREAFQEAINLFEVSYQESDKEHPDNQLDQTTKTFAQSLIKGALKEEEKNTQLITQFLSNQNLDRVDRMNLAVLLLGTFEIQNNTETSPNIFINEYVEIAKKYCPNEAAGFINSILDKVAKIK